MFLLFDYKYTLNEMFKSLQFLVQQNETVFIFVCTVTDVTYNNESHIDRCRYDLQSQMVYRKPLWKNIFIFFWWKHIEITYIIRIILIIQPNNGSIVVITERYLRAHNLLSRQANENVHKGRKNVTVYSEMAFEWIIIGL